MMKNSTLTRFKDVKRPKVPMVKMDFNHNDEATRRLADHAVQRVIKEHHEELQRLAYR